MQVCGWGKSIFSFSLQDKIHSFFWDLWLDSNIFQAILSKLNQNFLNVICFFGYAHYFLNFLAKFFNCWQFFLKICNNVIIRRRITIVSFSQRVCFNEWVLFCFIWLLINLHCINPLASFILTCLNLDLNIIWLNFHKLKCKIIVILHLELT